VPNRPESADAEPTDTVPAYIQRTDTVPADTESALQPARTAVFALVATHRSAGLESLAGLRGRDVPITPAGIAELDGVEGAVVLSTCNRFEVYWEARAEEAAAAKAAIVQAIGERSGWAPSTVAASLTVHSGAGVARHLFAVGAGLDSAVVGEREIAGQLRRALAEAQAAGAASCGLVRLFQAASRTAREVGARTSLGSTGRSVVSVGLELALENSAHPDLSRLSVVVLGTGAYAGSTLALLQARGCRSISVFSQSGRAHSFVATRCGAAITRTELPAAVRQADVVIGCSGSGSRLGADALEDYRRGATGPLAVIDLALSRDFEPDVAMLPGVRLITLDAVRRAAPKEHGETLAEAHALVEAAAERFEEQQKMRSLDAAIVALRKHTMGVLNSEMDRVAARHGCSASRAEVEFALRRMVRQLLHVPTARAREMAAAGRTEEYTAALEVLFGLTVPADGVIPHDVPHAAEPTAAAAITEVAAITEASGGSACSANRPLPATRTA
jgi:glutamyl-tRNA reductase